MGYALGTATNLRAIELPTGVRDAVQKLLAGIEAAETIQGVNMAGHRAEGFVLGLETASAFRASVIEALYIGLYAAVCARRLSLSCE